MTSSHIKTGGCLCGPIGDRMESPFKHVCHCHCSMCRRLLEHEGDTPR